MKPLIAVLGMLLVSALAACQSTQVSTVWKSPDPPPAQPFSKLVAIVVNATPAERRAAEDQLASEARSARGIPAYTIIPDDDLKDRDTVRDILKAQGIDGAVVLRLVSTNTQGIYHPPNYSSGSNFYNYRSFDLYSPGYSVTTVTIHAEISVYSVADERLLWAGASATNDPANIGDLVRQVAKASVEELKRQGLIK